MKKREEEAQLLSPSQVFAFLTLMRAETSCELIFKIQKCGIIAHLINIDHKMQVIIGFWLKTPTLCTNPSFCSRVVTLHQ